MGKKKRADLGLAIDTLHILIQARLPRDHPDHKYQKKFERPSLERALALCEKQYVKDHKRKLARSDRG